MNPATKAVALLAAVFFTSISLSASTGIEIKEEKLKDSAVDLIYVLGNNLRRFIAESKNETITGRYFVDKQLIKEGQLDSGGYKELVQKISTLVTPHRQPANDALCRTPFKVFLRVGNDTQRLTGCRSSGYGSIFSRITRDAEFLLYSKK